MEQKMSKLIGVYAGSFDPLSFGHVWMIAEAAKLFDTLIVAIGINPSKKATYALQDRLDVIYASIKDISTRSNEQIVVDSFVNMYLVDFAQAMNATHVVRGIRSATDFAYEQGMRHINADLKPDIHSMFLIPPRELSEISSSFVKGLIGPNGWKDMIGKYVPPPVEAMILRYHKVQSVDSR
jgi:pantetheine-phosphate adenylyltransferase